MASAGWIGSGIIIIILGLVIGIGWYFTHKSITTDITDDELKARLVVDSERSKNYENWKEGNALNNYNYYVYYMWNISNYEEFQAGNAAPNYTQYVSYVNIIFPYLYIFSLPFSSCQLEWDRITTNMFGTI